MIPSARTNIRYKACGSYLTVDLQALDRGCDIPRHHQHLAARPERPSLQLATHAGATLTTLEHILDREPDWAACITHMHRR